MKSRPKSPLTPIVEGQTNAVNEHITEFPLEIYENIVENPRWAVRREGDGFRSELFFVPAPNPSTLTKRLFEKEAHEIKPLSLLFSDI